MLLTKYQWLKLYSLTTNQFAGNSQAFMDGLMLTYQNKFLKNQTKYCNFVKEYGVSTIKYKLVKRWILDKIKLTLWLLICKMDSSFFELRQVHCQFQEFQGKHFRANSYTAWADSVNVQAGLVLNWWQSCSVFSSSTQKG